MHLETMNPTAPGKATMGFGVSQSSAACEPQYSISAAVVHKLQRTYRVSELHALTIAHLASIGPKEGR
jgi:hypothetical protein